MASTQPKTIPPAAARQFSVITGLSIGIGLAISRDVATALAPRLGPGGAFAAKVVAAGVVSGLVALVLSWLWKRVGRITASTVDPARDAG